MLLLSNNITALFLTSCIAIVIFQIQEKDSVLSKQGGLELT